MSCRYRPDRYLFGVSSIGPGVTDYRPARYLFWRAVAGKPLPDLRCRSHDDFYKECIKVVLCISKGERALARLLERFDRTKNRRHAARWNWPRPSHSGPGNSIDSGEGERQIPHRRGEVVKGASRAPRVRRQRRQAGDPPANGVRPTTWRQTAKSSTLGGRNVASLVGRDPTPF